MANYLLKLGYKDQEYVKEEDILLYELSLIGGGKQ